MGRMAIVVGGGIGGLSAARALTLTGWEVAVYEQAPAIGPVGAGIGIAPNAVKAMAWLGLGPRLRERGVRQDGLEVRLRTGRSVARLTGAAIETNFGEPFLTLHRAELHQILRDSLGAVPVHTDHRATGVTTGPDTATVTFATPRGPVTAHADLVVAADGVHSGLRGLLFPAYPGSAYAGYTVWRGIVPAPAARGVGVGVEPILTETWGRAARFGIAVINDGQVYWFACESRPPGQEVRHEIAGLAARFRDWHAPIPRLLAATPQDTLLRHDVYYLKDSLPSFVRGRVALLGDAAHAVTPDIGQGACLAIEDAVILANSLAGSGIDDALATYDAVRRPRTERLAQTSGKIGHVLQLGNPVAIALRDGIVRALPAALFGRLAGGAFSWAPPPDLTPGGRGSTTGDFPSGTPS